ncbi:unnamed protein product, partial [Allacma fusca]
PLQSASEQEAPEKKIKIEINLYAQFLLKKSISNPVWYKSVSIIIITSQHEQKFSFKYKMKGVVFHFLVAANLLRFPYPNVNRNEKYFDEYHGVKVIDPYRWLEQLDSLSTKKFV